MHSLKKHISLKSKYYSSLIISSDSSLGVESIEFLCDVMHLQHSAAAILAVASCAQAISPSNVTSIPKSSLFERRNPPYFNDEDLSFIKKIAAIGDSYSAGIGAGDRLGGDGDWSCSRYSESYPMLFNEDERFGDSKDRKFQFKSCSGAVVKDVLDNQIPEISDGQDVILLSAGMTLIDFTA